MLDQLLPKAWNWARQIFSGARALLNLSSIQKNVDLISKILFSLLQIFLIIIVVWFLINLHQFIGTNQEGITILPFDTSGMGEGYSGKAVADRLSLEMQRINETYKFKHFLINSKGNATLQIPSADGTPFQAGPMIPFTASKDQIDDKSISQMGNIDVGPASVSLGQLLLILRSTTGSSPKTITGSLVRYGSNISMVALMDDKNASVGARAWEISIPVLENESLSEGSVPLLIKDMAYNIAHDISRKDKSWPSDPHKKWTAFKCLTEGWDACREYNITGHNQYLKKAMFIIEAVSQTDPDSVELMQLKLIVQSEYQTASNGANDQELLDIATEIPVLSADAWYNRGVLFYSEGNIIKALEAFDRAVAIEPQNQLYWVSKSFALNKWWIEDQATSRAQEALMAAEMAIELDPKYADAWHEKGIALYDLEKYNDSEEAHKMSIELDKNKWWYYHDYALLLWQMGKEGCLDCYDEAIDALDKALKLDLNNDERDAMKSLAEYIRNSQNGENGLASR